MTPAITIQNVRTPVIDAGSGPPVLFLHGVPDSGDLWRGVIERLKAHYRCIAPDLPGLGRSSAPRDFDYRLENRAQWVDDLLRTLEIGEPLHIVGHDHGGPFAAAWAVQHPQRARTLTLINTLFHRDYRWHFWARLWRTPLLGELVVWGQLLPINHWLVEFELLRGSAGLSKEHVRAVIDNLRWESARHTLRLYRASDPADFAGWDDKLYALAARQPLLLLWGDKDPYISTEFPERLRSKGAQVVRFAAAGHWLPLEKAAAVSAELLRFFGA
ncbi:MAG: alpha/beta hydrolase [Chloroflexi bacterium]|nr:alpha/beta hydrolase [Chloroflexota bacterium]